MNNRKSLSFLLAFIFMLSIAVMSAQSDNYLHSSIDFEVGAVKVRDYTPVRPFNVDLGYRYMATPIIGAKLSLNYTRLYEQWDFKGYEEPTQYVSGTLMGVINIGRLAQMEDVFNNKVTILSGIGGNLSRSNGSTNSAYFYRNTNFHLAAFTDLEFKVSKRVFLRTGIDVVTGVNVERVDFKSETTSILNFNVGATIALGNGNKEHADWYVRPQKVDTIMMQPTIIDKTVTNNITKEVQSKCDCSIQRYLYFANNSYELTQDTQEAIEYSKDEILKGKTVILKGYCSNLGTVDLNKELAKNRVLEVKKALIGIGVPESRIQIEAVGIDYSRDKEVFAFGRRVELKVKQ